MTSTPPVVSSDEEVFQWDDISYSVQFKGQEKQILRAVSGAVAGGELCAIIGPSGAGKTSLLNILAGRISSRGAAKRVGGTVKLNGESIGPAALRQRIAYVMQQDLILPTQTVREALHFSAMLRLPTSVVESERRKLVEEMLSDLGLLACADTYVGDEMIRGISGGEKKRLSIGIELVMKPKLIFLDEPTSGLDSFAAHSVVNKMRSIAEHGKCNVLCTIHQPSSEAFHAFHKAAASPRPGPVDAVTAHPPAPRRTRAHPRPTRGTGAAATLRAAALLRPDQDALDRALAPRPAVPRRVQPRRPRRVAHTDRARRGAPIAPRQQRTRRPRGRGR